MSVRDRLHCPQNGSLGCKFRERLGKRLLSLVHVMVLGKSLRTFLHCTIFNYELMAAERTPALVGAELCIEAEFEVIAQ